MSNPPTRGSQVLGPAGKLPVDRKGGRLVDRQGWGRGLLQEQEPRSPGEKTVSGCSSWQHGYEGQQAREEVWMGLGWGGEGRAESLTCPSQGWLEVPSPAPGGEQDRVEKHSTLPIFPEGTPTHSWCPPLPSHLAGGHWPGSSREGPG